MKKYALTAIMAIGLYAMAVNTAHAQCAGTDATVTICDKDTNPALQTYDLFAQLGGSPVAGGSWVSNDPTNNDALDPATGILNLWNINNAGVHTFTYSNPSCDSSTATITVELGGYAGEDNMDGNANACQDAGINMFAFVDSSVPGLNADLNGVWAEDPGNLATGMLSGSLLDARTYPPGFYTFTYTLPAVGTCSIDVATVILEIHQEPNPGLGQGINLCESDDLSGLTNVNLFDQLINEDNDGVWSEDQPVGQISGPSDSFINIQELYDDNGPGVYGFRYTVSPDQGVCTPASTVVFVTIEEQFELVGTLSIDDYCLGNGTNTVTLSYDPSLLSDGIYDLTYTLSGGVTATTTLSDVSINGGSFVFTLTESIPANQEVFIDITGLGPTVFCTSVISVPQESFTINDVPQPSIAATEACFDEASTVTLSNVFQSSLALSNETYAVSYELTAPSGAVSTQTSPDITFANGEGSFAIADSILTEDGVYAITIANPLNFTSPCSVDPLTTSFNIIPEPEAIQLAISTDNQCDATSLEVVVNAPTLPNGSYIITYTVIEQDTGTSVINNVINFAGGSANFDVDITGLNDGFYTVELSSVQNDTTPCRRIFDFTLSDTFAINGTPQTPDVPTTQNFCLADFDPNVPTVADLVTNDGSTVNWYEDDTATTPLDPTTPLVDGEDYFAGAEISGCENETRAVTVVSLIQTDTVTTIDINPDFCGSDNATVADLDVLAPNGGNIIWYDAATDGNVVPDTTLLEDGVTYYAVEESNGCESGTRLEVTPTVTNVPTPTIGPNTGQECGIEMPTIADLDVTIDSAYDIIWYDNATDGNELSTSETLVDGAIYYVVGFDPITGCESPRVAIPVSLGNCDPEDFDSLIPDGFSPNGDTINDTYRLVNFEFIFPNYTIEIFNRYGKKVFEGNAITGPWDGKSSTSSIGSDVMPNGVYFYIINFNRDNMPPKQGRLYLSR